MVKLFNSECFKCSLRLAATADFMLVKRARRELNDQRRALLLPCLHSVAREKKNRESTRIAFIRIMHPSCS
jgi:hypothetical protein